jgi:phosphatidylinositol alpha-mannosyltransferase
MRRRSGRPLHILLTHHYAWPEVRRGGERYLHELGAALHWAGHRVAICTTSPTPGRAEVLGVRVRYLPRRTNHLHRYLEQASEACFGLEVLIREALAPLDVWHAFGTADGAAAATLGRWRPGVRSAYLDLGSPSRVWRDGRPDTDLHERIVRDVDEYLCLSEYSNGFLRSDYGREGRVVGGGVDLDRFGPAERRTPAPTLVFPSAVNESRKNLPLLLEAVAVLRRRRVDVRLLLCGPGDPSAVLSAAPDEARLATDVLGVPGDADLVRIYGQAWATVLPAEFEAFGLVLVESLACGTPVVTLAEGAPAEVAQPGVGFRSADGSAEALADACEDALGLAADPASVEACRTVAEGYDWKTAVVPRIEAAYRGEPAP